MIIQRQFSKFLRDKNALELAEERLKGVRQKQHDFLKKNLETSVISDHPEKVRNDEIAFRKRLGRVERRKKSDIDFANGVEEYFGKV